MNYIESKKFALEDVLRTFSYDDKHAEALTSLASCCPKETATGDIISAIAWWIAQDLYSETSTDQVNLERIAFGLESASRELLSLGTRLRDINQELYPY